MILRLSEVVTHPYRVHSIPQTETIGGKAVITYTHSKTFVPDKEYLTDDEATIKFFRNHTTKVTWTASSEKVFKEKAIPYTIDSCKVCGGRAKKIVFHPVEVRDE